MAKIIIMGNRQRKIGIKFLYLGPRPSYFIGVISKQKDQNSRYWYDCCLTINGYGHTTRLFTNKGELKIENTRHKPSTIVYTFVWLK